ncbi:MAG: phage portal protein [Ignavibacteria bacterium]|nr:phage portal protein [Ignavibacteria bacterium]
MSIIYKNANIDIDTKEFNDGIPIANINNPLFSNQFQFNGLNNYQKIAIGTIFSCLNYRATSMAKAIPVMYQRLSALDNPEVDEHPFLNLLNNPNPKKKLSKVRLYRKTSAHIDIYGESFWYLAAGKKFGEPKEIFILQPDLVQIRTDDYGYPIGYIYNNFNTKSGVEFSPDEIIHFRQDDYFTDSERGLSLFKQNLVIFNIYYQQTIYQNTFLKNDAMPKFVIQSTKNMSEQQLKKLREGLEKQHSGPNNAGNTMILSGGLEAKPLSLNMKDLDYVNSRNLSSKEIQMLFSVPEGVLDVNANNRSTASVHVNTYYENTLLPIIDSIDSQINLYINDKYPKDKIYLKHTLKRASDDDLEFKKIKDLRDKGDISCNEYRKFNGYSPVEGNPTGFDEIGVAPKVTGSNSDYTPGDGSQDGLVPQK